METARIKTIYTFNVSREELFEIYLGLKKMRDEHSAEAVANREAGNNDIADKYRERRNRVHKMLDVMEDARKDRK